MRITAACVLLLGVLLVLPQWVAAADTAATPIKAVGGKGETTGQWAFMAAYTVVWLILFAYLAYVAHRTRRAEHQLTRVQQMLNHPPSSDPD